MTYRQRMAISAVQARMNMWGWSDRLVDGHLSKIYDIIHKGCRNFDSRGFYSHKDTEAVNAKLCKVLREGGYEVDSFWNKKRLQWDVYFNW
ncbi:hypothetical protein [Yersinia phage vB_YenM_P778]